MIDRDVIEIVGGVALCGIVGSLLALIGYALGRMRGEDPPADLEPKTYHLTPEESARLEELIETTKPSPALLELLRSPTPEPGSWATSTLWLCPPCPKCSGPMVQGIDAYWCRSCEHEEPYEQAAPTVVDARERR